MVDRKLASLVNNGGAHDVRDACRYVLSGGGKRVRAVLTLLSCEAVGGTVHEALNAAAAIEILHNFTLVHDDIMDNSHTRRGRPTVHAKWNVNTALLTGDVLLGAGYRSLLAGNPRSGSVLTRVFTSALIDVCEGQALDVAFEGRSDVTVNEYYRMIEKKTAALLSAATELGGLMGKATAHDRTALRRYGRYLGRAFQLRDDLLDVVADQRNLGKPVGGDIIGRKKTFLLLRAAERATGDDSIMLASLLQRGEGANPAPPGVAEATTRQRLVETMTSMYRRYGVLEEAEKEIRRNTREALRSLGALRRGRAREMLQWLAEMLVARPS